MNWSLEQLRINVFYRYLFFGTPCIFTHQALRADDSFYMWDIFDIFLFSVLWYIFISDKNFDASSNTIAVPFFSFWWEFLGPVDESFLLCSTLLAWTFRCSHGNQMSRVGHYLKMTKISTLTPLLFLTDPIISFEIFSEHLWLLLELKIVIYPVTFSWFSTSFT